MGGSRSEAQQGWGAHAGGKRERAGLQGERQTGGQARWEGGRPAASVSMQRSYLGHGAAVGEEVLQDLLRQGGAGWGRARWGPGGKGAACLDEPPSKESALDEPPSKESALDEPPSKEDVHLRSCAQEALASGTCGPAGRWQEPTGRAGSVLTARAAMWQRAGAQCR